MLNDEALNQDTDAIAVLLAKGNLQEAQKLVDDLLVKQPNNAAAWHIKGLIHSKAGDKANAITYLNKAVQCKPDFAEACFDLAVLLEQAGHLLLSIKTYEYLLKIAPSHNKGKGRLASLRNGKSATQAIEEYFAHGKSLLTQCNAEMAVSAYQKALAIRPDIPEVLTNLSTAFNMLRRFGESEQALLECLRLRPNYAEALNSLGNLYKNMNAHEQAITAYRQCVKHKPKFLEPWVNLGIALQETGDVAGSITAYERALKINPRHAEVLAYLTHQLHYLCRWDRLEILMDDLEKTLASTQQSAQPFIVALNVTPTTQLVNAKRWSESHYANFVPYNPGRALPAGLRANGKKRIGYLSSDFHKHATAFLISEMFERHDRENFEIYAYSSGVDDGSSERERIKQGVNVFRDIAIMSDHDAAGLIQNDGIDILVDMKGYTQGHRMGLLALRPAPIQMHYLGYPGTSGAPFIDYFISDNIATPQGADETFSECLIRLPYSYQINDRARPLSSVVKPRGDYGLPDNGFVFGSLNRVYKITPAIFKIWMRLLTAVEGSVLWIYETDSEASANLKNEAKKLGIEPERIIIAGVAPLAEHLARYKHIDLFLDTAPCNGHTTASDALWCGAPVVTLAGSNFASRVCASLLNAVELPELVTTDMESYEALALKLACDPEKLRNIRKHLEAGRMNFPLFDSVATTKAIEAAYLHAAELHIAAIPPKSFTVTTDFEVIKI